MATLNITTTQDFTSTVFNNPLVNLIQFGNPLATTAQGTFRASQFNNVNISSSVSIAGSDGANIVRVAMLVGGPASSLGGGLVFLQQLGNKRLLWRPGGHSGLAGERGHHRILPG